VALGQDGALAKACADQLAITSVFLCRWRIGLSATWQMESLPVWTLDGVLARHYPVDSDMWLCWRIKDLSVILLDY
jgi:hypothetical protein